MKLELTHNDVAHPSGLEISIAGFKGDVGSERPSQVFIEYYNGELRIHVWNGNEDPATSFVIPLQSAVSQ